MRRAPAVITTSCRAVPWRGALMLLLACAIVLAACAVPSQPAESSPTAASAVANTSSTSAVRVGDITSQATGATTSAATGVSSVAGTGTQSTAGPTPTPGPLPATATPTADASLAVVQQTFLLMMDKFFKPVTSQALLSAAWQGAVQEARSEGVSTAPQRPTLTGDPQADMAAYAQQYEALVKPLSGDHQQIAFAAADAITQSVNERHTYFLTPSQVQQFTASSSGQSGLVGIGVQLAQGQNGFLVADIFPDSPAQKGGMQLGDAITAVNGQNVRNASLAELSAALRGQEGTTVKLDVSHADGSKATLTLTRAQVYEPLLESRVLTPGVCYVRLHQFPMADQLLPDGNTIIQDLDADLTACQQAQVKGWVLDLRGNPGGADVDRFTSRFIAQGVIATSRDRLNARYEMAPEGHLFPQQLPLAVLVDSRSGSSSEILASAVQDLHRGIVVGTHSAGVVNGTELIPLPLNAMLGVAVNQLFRGATDTPLDGTGVTPDVQVSYLPPTASDLAQGLDSQISRAVQEVLSLQYTPAAATPVASAMLSPAVLQQTLDPLIPAEAAVPATGQAKRVDVLIDTIEAYASGNPDLVQARARALRLGFQGAIIHRYGAVDAPDYTVAISLYASADGAIADMDRIYQPGEAQNPNEDITVQSPVQLGDETAFRIGTGPNAGTVTLNWRHGRVLLQIEHDGTAGEVPADALATLAKAIDAQYAQHPVP